MKELVVATRNKGKLKEIEASAEGCVGRVLSYRRFSLLP